MKRNGQNRPNVDGPSRTRSEVVGGGLATAAPEVSQPDLSVILASLQTMGDGDFSVRLPGSWTGLAGKLADTFNDIASSNQQIAKELKRVGQVVGKEGRTRERTRFHQSKGAWGEMEVSVNTLVDDLLRPTTEVTRAIAAVAQGNLTQTVRLDVDGRPLEGEFLRSATIVNTMIQQLGVFTAEVTRVAREVLSLIHIYVVSHVIIKADVRGSTKMTQDLLSRGLNPASHFSLNLHEPVKKLLDRYAAKKVFIEGDAVILAIFETDSNRAYARAVAKACILSRQILAVCNSYNDRAASTDLPGLELGIGVAFQGSAPTYWVDGDSRIMISKALNLSDRLSGCAKIAKRLMTAQKTHFSVFQFLTAMKGASAEELDEFLVRFNMNGIELNEEEMCIRDRLWADRRGG